MMYINSTDEPFSISDYLGIDTRRTIVTVNIVALVGAISIFGIAFNIINILVFCKQGFSETTNISYTALAISDLLSMVASLGLSIFWNPLFLNSGLPLMFVDIQAVFANAPYGCFSRITGWVTAFVCFERCLCVVWPLQVKMMLTSTITIIFVVSIYMIMFLTMVPLYSPLLLIWRSDPRTNRTLLGIIVQIPELVTFSYSLHSAIQVLAFLSVLVCTVTLIVCMRQVSWRMQQMRAQDATKRMTKRQVKAVKMVTLIAAMYVVGCLPTIVSLAVTVLYPNYSAVGRYKNTFFTVWSFVVLGGVLNSSINFPVYYHMSSKFKHTCDQILSRFITKRFVKHEDIPTGNGVKELQVK